MSVQSLQIGKIFFKTEQCLEETAFFGHIYHKFRRPTILPLNIEDLTASKMNVLHYLALQFEALVIPPQETHWTSAEKLLLPSINVFRERVLYHGTPLEINT